MKNFAIPALLAFCFFLVTGGLFSPLLLLTAIPALVWTFLFVVLKRSFDNHRVVRAAFALGSLATLVVTGLVQSGWYASHPLWEPGLEKIGSRLLVLLALSCGGTLIVWLVCRLFLVIASRLKASARRVAVGVFASLGVVVFGALILLTALMAWDAKQEWASCGGVWQCEGARVWAFPDGMLRAQVGGTDHRIRGSFFDKGGEWDCKVESGITWRGRICQKERGYSWIEWLRMKVGWFSPKFSIKN